MFEIFLNRSQIYICHSQFTYSVQKINIYIIIFFLQGRNLGHCQDVAADSTVPRKGHTATTPQRNHIATTSQPHRNHGDASASASG